MYTQEAFHK